MFIGSYFPLAIILALQEIKQKSWKAGICLTWGNCTLPSSNHPYLSLGGIAVTFICLLLGVWVLKKIRCTYPVHILESKAISSELISYTIPYIISFMGADYSSVGKISGLLVFLVLLFWLTYCAGQTIMNPVLMLFGWDLYEVKATLNNQTRIIKVLSKGNLVPGECHLGEIQGNYICKGD